MCATIIAVLSYAFQIAGALLLLLWCIGKCDANVVKDCFRNHPAPLWLEMDEKRIEITYYALWTIFRP